MGDVSLENSPFRVLALDGGGMRGLYSATVLHLLATRYATEKGKGDLDVGKGFDLIAGTSTGGLLACALAYGCGTNDIMTLYREVGHAIFTDPTPVSPPSSKKKANWPLYKWAYRNLKKPSSNPTPLRERLASLFGNTTLEELYERRGIALCIPVTNFTTQSGQVFKTPHNPEFTRDRKYKLVDVCMATSAAPIYFPLVILDDPTNPGSCEAFADGGLWANSPVLIGLIEAVKLHMDRPIQVVSVSTCAPPPGRNIGKGAENWGLKDWKAGVSALELSLEAQAIGHNFMARLIAPYLGTGTPPCIIRLPSSPPSSEQALNLGLDRADDDALKILQQKARNDADMILSKMTRDEDGLGILKEILTGLPEKEG